MAVRARRRGRAAVDDGRSADGRSTDGHENAPIPASGDAVQAWVDGDGDPASVEVQHELDAPPWRRFESTLMATSRQIRRAYDGRLEKVDLNLSEACLLAYVVEHGPLTQTHVAERIGMGRAPAGTIVDSLSSRGLLVRSPDPSDRRVWMISATTSGLKLAAQVAEVEAELRVELRGGLDRHERQQLAATLVKLQANLARVLDVGD